jgi:hypothetical protein
MTTRNFPLLTRHNKALYTASTLTSKYMQVTQEYVQEFRELYLKYYGVELTEAEATDRAQRFINLLVIALGVDDLQ